MGFWPSGLPALWQNKYCCTRRFFLPWKLTTDRHETSHGLFATAELLVQPGHRHLTFWQFQSENVTMLFIILSNWSLVLTANTMKVSRQCHEAATKANRVLGMVHRQFKDLDKKSFLIIYKGFIRPHLEYAIQAWCPYLKGDIEHLEKVQRRATKLISGYSKLSYEHRLRKLNLTTLHTRRQRGDLIEAYKVITGKENIKSENFFHYIPTATIQGDTASSLLPQEAD